MFDILSWIDMLDLQVMLRLGLAVLLGGIIGAERELRGRPAGLRTMILVCLGSTLVMIVASRMPTPAALDSQFNVEVIRIDPGRIAAGVVTGIGFLGAGVILRLSDVIRGVTTAATIWFVAALGVIIGQGYYALAVVSAAFAMLVLWFFQYLERPLHGQVYPTLQLVLDSASASASLEQARGLLTQQHIRITELKAAIDVTSQTTEIQLFMRTKQRFQAHQVIEGLARLEGVRSVRWR